MVLEDWQLARPLGQEFAMFLILCLLLHLVSFDDKSMPTWPFIHLADTLQLSFSAIPSACCCTVGAIAGFYQQHCLGKYQLLELPVAQCIFSLVAKAHHLGSSWVIGCG